MSHRKSVTFTDEEWARVEAAIPHEKIGPYIRRIVMAEQDRHPKKRVQDASPPSGTSKGEGARSPCGESSLLANLEEVPR